MIKKFSNYLATLVTNELKANKDKKDIYSYALEIILGSTLKLTLILLLSFKLGILKSTLTCLASFITFRHFGGGAHLSTYSRCLTVGVFTFLILGKVAHINITIQTLLIYLLFIALLGTYIIIKWVPAGTQKKMITDKKIKLKQKKETIYILIIWILIVLILIKYELILYAFASILGVFNSLFFITPLGYWFFYKLDYIIDINAKGEIRHV